MAKEVVENIITEEIDHVDPYLNSLIKILKKESNQRSISDFIEIGKYLKNFPVFKEYGIEGRDLADLGEFIMYQFLEEDDEVIEAGQTSDNLYLIIDGHVEFQSDVAKNKLTGPQVDLIC